MKPLEEVSETEESPSVENAEARKLLDKIKDRESFFEKGWWKVAEEATNLYNNEKDDPANPYNILYSNTEVLKPSLYSATPKPDVRTRFIAQPASPVTQLVENLLIVFSDPSNPGEESFDNAMDQAVLSGLVSGMGFIRLRHYPKKGFPLCTESGHYKALIWAAGRKWNSLPWIAFRHELTKEEIFDQFGIPEEGQKSYKISDEAPDSDKPGAGEKSLVYECWEKKSRTVYYLSEDWDQVLIKEEPDPLKLLGFYPTPGLLMMTHKPGRLIPTPLYQYYKQQAEELNRVTARLNKVLSAIKVRGAYNSLLGTDMEKILSNDDMENALVPASESGMLMQNGGFERQVWMLPIEKLIEVASQLYNARIQIKQVIYEITGLSDIIRGSSVASETATAQNLKNKWGSIRLRDMQKFVASYVRDLYRLAVDAAVHVIPPEGWKEITRLPFPTNQEKAVAQQTTQYQQAILQQPPDPKLAQTLQSPSIEDLLSQIASDANRAYTINVQSDSTIDLDTATDKAEVTEFMNAMGQLMTGIQPLAALGPTGLEAAKSIVIAVSQRFKFGLQIVDSLKAIQAPPPAGQNPENEKKAAELAQKEKTLTQQESQLKDLLTKIEDAKRDLETQQKEFSADVKVFNAERAAQDQIAAARQEAQAAEEKARGAQENATFVQRKAELSTAAAGAKATQRASQKTSETVTPAVESMAHALADLQSAIKALSAPKSARKNPDGSWVISEEASA